MATVSDINDTPFSELNHIDALLDKGPDWNFLTSGTANTLYYTFSISSGTEDTVKGQEAFTLSQQSAARYAFNYLQQLTGIKFVETNSGTSAQLHLANIDISGSNTTGLCSWASELYQGRYEANAYIYLDNNEWYGNNRDLSPGGVGYQTLLHELGHALGLSHPFHEGDESHDIHLSPAQDNTANTIMSYTDKGGPYSTFSPYDVAALNWLYGGDGLGGALGVGSTTGGRYITGTSGADTLVGTSADDLFAGMGGIDVIQGGAGNDTVQFSSTRSAFSFSKNGSGDLLAAYAGGTITMNGIEMLRFTDGSVRSNDVVGNDTTAPEAPQLGVIKNAAGYAQAGPERKPVVSGIAEENSLVKVYYGERVVAEVHADANGVWQVATEPFPDGMNYSVRATATDAAGNVSEYSQSVTFNVDATPPTVPTMTGTLAQGGNQPVFSGTGEAGTIMQLFRMSDTQEIGRTTVKPDGTWQITTAPLPNGTYLVNGASTDIAGSATSTDRSLQFTIDNPLNVTGTDTADRFVPAVGNAAIDGGKGLDTMVYAGSSDSYLIQRGVYGVTVSDRSGATGTDNLINVERIQFADTMVALDIDGNAGQVYRLYRALFEREPDPTGLRFWINAADNGYTLNQISEFFLNQEETYALYTDPSDEFFVRALYDHVLQREPDPTGFKYWVDGLKLVSRAEALAFFSESPENKAQVIGSIQHGIEYPLPVA